MSERKKYTVSKTQTILVNAVLLSAGVGVVATGVFLRKKYNVKIENAKQAGVNEWLREMSDDGLSILVLPKPLVERMFEVAQDIALNEIPTK